MRIHTGAKILMATSAIVGGLGISWAAFNDDVVSYNACQTSMAPIGQARSGALKAIEKASEFDDDARDAAAMALQRWHATLERAARLCGLSGQGADNPA